MTRIEQAICTHLNNHFAIYDNGGKTADRYTAIHTIDDQDNEGFDMWAFNKAPFHPQGFGQYAGDFVPDETFVDWDSIKHLGIKIKAEDLNEDCIIFLIKRL